MNYYFRYFAPFFSFFLAFQHSAFAQHHLDTALIFQPDSNEVNCMNLFEPAPGYHPVNTFLLAKMNELMYPERLDFQLRWLHNQKEVPENIVSTNWLKAHPLVTNENFEEAFASRFRHYFPVEDSVSFHFLIKTQFDTLSLPWKKIPLAYDPEVIVIHSKKLTLLVFRGTDDAENNHKAEWYGSDYDILKIKTDSVLNFAKMHRGFWKSFDLIHTDLLNLLDSLHAEKTAIWISGQSLGGAMAMVCGIYLEKSGFPIAGIYAFASPSAIGGKSLNRVCPDTLKNRIYRFEYYLDPVSAVQLPVFYKNLGHRFWYDHSFSGNYQLYPAIPERHLMIPFPVMTFSKQKASARKNKKIQQSGWLFNLPYAFYYHNTQWLVKAAYNQLSSGQKDKLPAPEDSYPFIYYTWEKGK